MSDIFKIPVVSPIASGDYLLADCFSFDWVSIQVWWDNLDATDAIVTILERSSINNPWVEVPMLTYTLTSSSDSIIFIDEDFNAREVGIRINKGSCNIGDVNTYVRMKNYR